MQHYAYEQSYTCTGSKEPMPLRSEQATNVVLNVLMFETLAQLLQIHRSIETHFPLLQ